MAERYPSQSLPDIFTASGDQSEPMEDQYGPAVDQSGPMGHQHEQIADNTDPDLVRMLTTDQVSALQYAQKTGAANVTFIGNQYNVSGGQTIQNIDNSGQTQPSSSDMSKETAATFNLHECQEELRAFYLEETGKVNLLPWIPEESKEMESIFVDIELVRKGLSTASGNVKSDEDLVTLHNNQGQRVNRVLVTGDAGSGKSTTADNLAYKWASNNPQSSLFKFALVFLIRMKDIEDSNLSLVDLIFHHILPEDSNVSKEGLIMYIKENAKDILFVIDGMDEDSSGALKNKSNGITKLLHNRKLRKSCVILTTRPKNISDLGMHATYFTQVNLAGFSVKNIHKYIVKYFRDDLDKVEMLFKKLKAEPHILALASIPVLLLMICLLWEDQRITPKTKTQLYQKTIRYLWRRYKARMGSDSTLEVSDNEAPNVELSDLLNKLGEVALNNTHYDNNKFIFTEKEFGRDVSDLGCQVGILKKEQSRAGLERKTSVTFTHSTFEYFCAAVHLAYLLDTKQKNVDDFDGLLFSITENALMCHKYVLEFCCGIQQEVTTTFIQMIAKSTTKMASKITEPLYDDISIHMKLIFEGQLSHEQCSYIIPLFSSHRPTMNVTDDLIPSVLYMLDLYKTSATKTGFLSTVKLLKVNTGCTPWLPTLLKHTNSLFQCSVCIGDSEIIGDLDKVYKALSVLPNIKNLTLIHLGKHDPLVRRFDATNLLNFLIEKRVKLAEFHLYGFMFDERSMVRYLSCTRASILSLGLRGTLDAREQFASINNVIDLLPRLKHLNHLELSQFQIGSAVKHLRPIMSQLNKIGLGECCLHEKHFKELFSFLSRAQKIKLLDLSGNVLSVASVQALVENLNKLPALKELNLEETGLNDESACILARFVRGKPSINALCLDYNPDIGHEGKDALRGLPLRRLVPSGQLDGKYENTDTI